MVNESEETTRPAPLEEEDGFGDGEIADVPVEEAVDDEDVYSAKAHVGNSADESGAPVDDLRQLVQYLATRLVDEPDDVVVEAEQRGQMVNLTLRVPEHELGKVIGRQGRIARAIRTVLMIAGARHNLRASLDIEG